MTKPAILIALLLENNMADKWFVIFPACLLIWNSGLTWNHQKQICVKTNCFCHFYYSFCFCWCDNLFWLFNICFIEQRRILKSAFVLVGDVHTYKIPHHVFVHMRAASKAFRRSLLIWPLAHKKSFVLHLPIWNVPNSKLSKSSADSWALPHVKMTLAASSYELTYQFQDL